MELNQLRYFQKVAQVKSVTKAAQELYISQPTLSQSLSRLESSVGCPLFIRNRGRALELSPAGELFLAHVDRVFSELEDGIDEVRRFSHRASSQVALGSSVSDLCNELVLSFFQRHPAVHISQRLTEINALPTLLMNEEIDFAISPCPLEDPCFDCRPLYTEELLLLVGPGHRLYGQRCVDRDALLAEQFILNYSEADRNYLDMLYEEEGLEFNVLLESNEPGSIRRLVEAGAGVAFTPARILMRRYEEDPSILSGVLRVNGYRASTPTCITKKKTHYLPSASAEFFDHVAEFCRWESEMTARFLKQFF